MRLPSLLLSVALILSVVAGHAQSPPGINYQGIARNLDGKPLVLKDITIRINILKDGDNGDVEYSEIHTLKTNSFGLFTLVIGNGDVVSGDFRFISWAMGNKWLRVEMDPDGGSSFQLMGSQQFMSVPYAFYSKYSGNVLTPGQGISITNNVITNTGDGDSNPGNELNTGLTLSADRILRLTDAGGIKEVDLSPLAVNQSLSGVLTLGNNADGQKIANLGAPVLATDAVTKGYVDTRLASADLDIANELQDVSIEADKLKLTNSLTEVDLSPYLDNTDSQNLSFSGTTLSIGGGNSVNLSSLAVDAQDLSLNGITNTLSLSGDGTPVSLTPYLDNTDSQSLTFSGTTLSIAGGNSVSLSGLAIDAQDLSLNAATNTLSLSGDASPVNLAPYLDNTDNQQLTLMSHSLTLTNDATPVDLTPYLDDTDDQTLALSGTNLSINNGNSVSLAAFMDDTDDQDLTLAVNSLSLTGDATPVSLAPYLDNTDSQSLSVLPSGNNRTINISGGTGATFSVADGDSDQTNEVQSLAFNTTTKNLSISLGNSVNIPETQTVAQVLTMGNDAGGQRLTNLGAATVPSDAANKLYVDNADNAINARISANYAFKTNFTYSSLLSLGNDIPMPLAGESFDDSNVVGAANFTAATAGTYVFMVDGNLSYLLGNPSLSLLYNGTKYPVATANNRFNATLMFRLTAGQTVSLVGDGLTVGANVNGSFFGYKLL
ncbi:MAG TPA: hypothetical protein VK508_20155 [Cyclobacteriaceae bacterium]|nr:hypothetical protein [Cyclobacteriaceae bacterium]